MTAPTNAAALKRLEEKLDELTKGQTHVLERLASIEATSKAEAAERATIHHYTQQALESLDKRLEKEEAARIAGDEAANEKITASEEKEVAARRWAIGIGLTGFLLPLVVGLIFLVINSGVHG